MNRKMITFRVSGLVLLLTVILTLPSHGRQLTISVDKSASMLDTTGEFTKRILLKIELPAELSGARIDRAVLKLPMAFGIARKEKILRASALQEEWSASAVPLQNQPLSTYDSPTSVHFNRCIGDAMSEIDITEVLTAWVDGAIPNHGILVESVNREDASLVVVTHAEIPQNAAAVVKVWYTRKEVD